MHCNCRDLLASLHLNFLYSALIQSQHECVSLAWNNLTLSDSNKLENIQRTFVSLCYRLFIQSRSPRNYNPILNNLNFQTCYCRQHLDALFLVNALKNKIAADLSCCVIAAWVDSHNSARNVEPLIALRHLQHNNRSSPDYTLLERAGWVGTAFSGFGLHRKYSR
jgi:hypothetical protein